MQAPIFNANVFLSIDIKRLLSKDLSEPHMSLALRFTWRLFSSTATHLRLFWNTGLP